MEGIYMTENTLDVVKLKNKILVHKQIEKRNGRTYMRIKKRNLSKVYDFMGKLF